MTHRPILDVMLDVFIMLGIFSGVIISWITMIRTQRIHATTEDTHSLVNSRMDVALKNIEDLERLVRQYGASTPDKTID